MSASGEVSLFALEKCLCPRVYISFTTQDSTPDFVYAYSTLDTQLLLIYSPRQTRSNIFLLAYASILEELAELKTPSL